MSVSTHRADYPDFGQPSIKVVVPREPGPTEFKCEIPKIRDRGFTVKVGWEMNGRPVKPAQKLPPEHEEHEKGTLYEWEMIPRLKSSDVRVLRHRAVLIIFFNVCMCRRNLLAIYEFATPQSVMWMAMSVLQKLAAPFSPQLKVTIRS